MTIISLQKLAEFLNKYKISGNVADYGGTSKISNNVVKKMLALKNVRVMEGPIGENINIDIINFKSICHNSILLVSFT